MRCEWCGEEVEEGEPRIKTVGVVEIGERETRTVEVMTHRECILRQVIGSVAHQDGTCSCYGGEGEDDERLTKRQAARAAVKRFQGDCDAS